MFPRVIASLKGLLYFLFSSKDSCKYLKALSRSPFQEYITPILFKELVSPITSLISRYIIKAS